MTFARMDEEFKALNVQLIGLSVDSIYAHIAWLRTIKEKIRYKGMENMEVAFPLIEDVKMDVANKFGMIQPNAATTQAVRAVFIIDPTAKIRCILYYPLSTGRNFDEIKRIVLALQKADAEGVATPADWRPGQGTNGLSGRREVLPGLVHVLPEGKETIITGTLQTARRCI